MISLAWLKACFFSLCEPGVHTISTENTYIYGVEWDIFYNLKSFLERGVLVIFYRYHITAP